MEAPWLADQIVGESEESTEAPWEKDPVSKAEEDIGAMPFVNKAIGETLEFIPKGIAQGIQKINAIPGVDIGNIEEIPGKIIRKGFEAIGAPYPEREPRTMDEYVGQGVGEVASFLLPVGGSLSKLSRGAGLTGKITKSIWESFVKHPYIGMISELTGGAGAGVGRGATAEMAPGNQTAQTIGTTIGGIIGGAAPSLYYSVSPTMFAIKNGKTILRRMVGPFTEKGAKFRAGEFVKDLVINPAETAKNISKETIGDLPPAVASGEKRLVGLYKSLINQDPKTNAEAIENLSQSIVKLEGEMRQLGYGSPDLLAEVTQRRIENLKLRMDQRVIRAMDRAQQKLDKLPVALKKVDESRIVRSELEKTMRAEQVGVRKLWNQVPKELEVPMDETRAIYTSLKDDLAKAQREDLPGVLKLSSIFKMTKKGNWKLDTTSIKEMQGLRSKLLETARISRKNGKWNKARISQDIADAILDDLDNADGSEELRAAIDATRHFKMRFESGVPGKILGYSKSGAPAIDPDLTLDISIGRMGTKGSIDLQKVAVTPEAMEATERYLGRSFTDFALDKTTGKIKPTKANDWIRSNEAILDKFPNLKEQLADSAKAQDFANKTILRMEARKQAISDPKISVAAKFLKSNDVNTEVSTILKSKNPIMMSKELVKQARKDPTGDAMRGVRAGFVDYILEKSSVGPYNELGEQTLSGNTILNFINKNTHTLNEIFEPNQIARMKQVGKELSKIESFDKLGYGKPDIEMKDFSSTALRLFARVGGARLGGWIARETPGGSLQTASIVSGQAKNLITKLSRDRANQMIQDAVLSSDPTFLKSLLLPLDKPLQSQFNWKRINNRLNIWLLGEGKRVLDDLIQESELGE